MFRFFNSMLNLYEAVCAQSNNYVAHQVCKLIDERQLMYCVQNQCRKSKNNSLNTYKKLTFAFKFRSIGRLEKRLSRSIDQTSLGIVRNLARNDQEGVCNAVMRKAGPEQFGRSRFNHSKGRDA